MLTMGTAASRTWVPGSELGIWKAPAWPSKHTDELGRAMAFQEGGRWQNPWREGVPSPAHFFYDWFLAGRDESNIPNKKKLDETNTGPNMGWKRRLCPFCCKDDLAGSCHRACRGGGLHFSDRPSLLVQSLCCTISGAQEVQRGRLFRLGPSSTDRSADQSQPL